jgi:fatty acid desaturase
MNDNPSRSPHSAVRFPLQRELLARLTRRAPWRLLCQTLAEWLCIVVLIVVAEQCASLPVSLLCMLLIATRQHALLALMHDYSHYQLSRDRRLNDLVGDLFTALPFFITVHGFRRNHLQHHRHTSSELDPNWMSSLRKARYRFPMSRARFWLEVLKHGVGVYTLEELKGYTLDSGMAIELPRPVRITRAVFALALVAAATAFGLWSTLLLYWIVPMSTVLMAILYLRDVGEHFGMPADGVARSRTVKAGWLDRLLISQNGVNFHAEHHVYPSVPFFRLGRLHDALMRNDDYRRHALVTRGYLTGLVNEVTCGPGDQDCAGVRPA